MAVISTLALTAIIGAGLGNLFMLAPLPYRISVLGAVLATDAAAARASRLTVREVH